MLDVIVYGTDMCGNVYPEVLHRTPIADGVDGLVNKYIQSYPTICHVRVDVALPMHDGNILRRVG